MGRKKKKTPKWTMLYKREVNGDEVLRHCIYEPLHKGELNQYLKRGWQQLNAREGR